MLTKKTILKVKDLLVAIEGNVVLRDVNFDLMSGELLMVLGPNGAGKSVLIKTILGILPFSGKINFGFGRKNKKKIGYVPQYIDFDRSFPLTVREVIELGWESNWGDKRRREKELARVIDTSGLVELENKNFGSLSGGQIRRVLIAQALIGSPELLILDEPMAGVDMMGEKTFYDVLRDLKKEQNVSIVMVSHDYSLVNKIADKVLCLNNKMVCCKKADELSSQTFE